MSAFTIDAQSIGAILEENLRKFSLILGIDEVGRVLEAGDGIARVDGLPGVMAEEMILFPNGAFGMAMNLERTHVGTIILGDYSSIRPGDIVRRTGKVLQVPVGEALLGRVINALGQPLDGRGPIQAASHRLVETDAPGITERQPVEHPLYTGMKSIDAMTAIGRGQRELIIGDRQTGKTTLAVDAILNQVPGDVCCIYVAIGQKMSTVANVVGLLESRGRLQNCIVVVAAAGDSAPMQYIAPFAGCAMAEYFRDRGEHALIVYDDLSKHAVAYREISLVLRRPAGREAFPGDIFYLHSRLLERAAKLSRERGGGSLTALPIVETQQGDYSAYIPTNLISITDGQIYLENDLFYQGFRPAINVGLSVSRVGGKAQTKAMKKVALKLRLEFAQYRELAAFARLTADLDKATQAQLNRGARIAEILKQNQHEPLSPHHEVCALWAVLRGYLDDVPLEDVARFELEWRHYLDASHPAIGESVNRSGELDATTESLLETAMTTYRKIFVAMGIQHAG